MGPMRKRLARALAKGRESKTLYVVSGGLTPAGPIDLGPALDRLATSAARYGILGCGLPDLEVEDSSEQAQAQAPSKVRS
jgi:hypothetical protein